MNLITRSCVLFLWMHTLAFVKSQAIKCVLPAPEGTTYEPAFRSLFLPGETVNVTCGEKYWISTPQDISAVSTCQDNGEWTIRPVCQEVTCTLPENPLNHWYNFFWGKILLGRNISYHCEIGYKATSNATVVTCTRDGIKPDQDQLCREILDCGTPPLLANGDIKRRYGEIMKSQYKHDERVEYKCQTYYTMEGERYKTCNDGEWIGHMRCRDPPGCENPPPTTGGDVKNITKRQYSHNERAEYTCRNDYTMQGVPYLTCFNGEWTGERFMRCRKSCTLSKRVMKEHNIAFRFIHEQTIFVHNEEIEFKCAKGRPHNTVGMIFRCDDGVLELPTCR